MGPHVFVDETKERGFLLAAAAVEPEHLVVARQVVARLTLRGQRSIHFCKERDERRRQILTTMRSLTAEVVLYDGTAYRSQKDARDACLRALVEDAAKAGAERLVLELDDSRRSADARLLNAQLRLNGLTGGVRYDHLRAYEDCLLAVPDAVAWSWAKGGEWRATVRPMVRDIREV
ncbi:hypothetical protein ACFY3U_15465 [Micromonospora sp. NPDC000089]|uniref:hypothetical protein n=1 Tax=unclassified Micromonospora TaxID=2617518 RepID=UPI0036A20B7C